MLSRREFSGLLGAALVGFRDDTCRTILALSSESEPDPEDETYWAAVRSAFFIDPTLTVFNHAGMSPPPKAIFEADQREARRAAGNPSYVIYRKQQNELDSVRRELGTLLGCPADWVSLVPNASYGLHSAIMGLQMAQGDEILIPALEYPRSFTAALQRERRDKVKLVRLNQSPVVIPARDFSNQIIDAVNSKTRLVVVSEIGYLNAQRIDTSWLAAGLRVKGVPFIIDAAQSIGLIDQTLSATNHPIFAACLHKWIMAPSGTGVFCVAPDWRERVWSLQASDEGLNASNKKYEQTGSRPLAPILAIREALEMHYKIGSKSKLARLLYLRHRLVSALEGMPNVKFFSSLNENDCLPFVTVGFTKGTNAALIASKLLDAHKIHVTTAVRDGVDGIRISPSMWTSLPEIDRLVAALASIKRAN